MRPSEWVKERIADTARHFPLVWVEDPYRLLEAEDLAALDADRAGQGHDVIAVNNALRLRERLEGRTPGVGRVVVIDQSQVMRQPDLLPRDAAPGDFKSLPAPDWKPLVQPEARLRPTIRDYLASVTGDKDWPPQVNLFPYERLARDDPDGFTKAFDTFRRMGRPLTSDDLILVGASTILRVDLFDAARPIEALELAFHSQARWDALAEYFNNDEIEAIRSRLRGLPRPVGDLFGEERDTARAAVVALRVLAQHFEQPGKHLRFLASALGAFRTCEISASETPPSWFIDVEIPLFDRMVTDDFLDYLRSELDLDDPAKAQSFADRECLSPRLQDLVPFDVEMETLRHDGFGDIASLKELVPQFKESAKELSVLIGSVRPLVERLKLHPIDRDSVSRV